MGPVVFLLYVSAVSGLHDRFQRHLDDATGLQSGRRNRSSIMCGNGRDFFKRVREVHLAQLRTQGLASGCVLRSEHTASRCWNQSHICGQQESFAKNLRIEDQPVPVRPTHTADACDERVTRCLLLVSPES